MAIPISLKRFHPEWATPGYSARDALSLCLASRVAYETDPAAILQTWGFHDVECFHIVRGHDIDTQGYVAADQGHILAAFRGTESIPDWLTNLQAMRDPGPWANTKVHEGFQDAFMAAALKIGEVIGRRRQPNQHVWVTGHSLGGALAVLLVATLLESSIPVEGLYTFAAPRVGDDSFAKQLNSGLRGKANWRVVNAGDLVTHLPPEMFFCHAGKRYLLESVTATTSKTAWKHLKKDMWGWIGENMIRPFKITAPHKLDS